MILFATLPSTSTSIDVSNLWLSATVLIAALPPFLLGAYRQRWQFTIREILLLFVVVALILGLTKHEILEVVDGAKGGDYCYSVSLPLKDTTPLELVGAISSLSLIYTMAIYSVTRKPEVEVAPSDEAEPSQEE